MNTFGERLKEQREELSLSQEAFGRLGGVKKRAQINYEQGLRAPDLEYLASLAGAGVDVQYVITGRKEMAPPITEQLVALSDQHRLQLAIEAVEEGLLQVKRKLPPAQKAELIVAAYELMAEPEQAKNNVIRLVRVAA